MKIYVASSWRNPDQPRFIRNLRADGHEVYDFRHPAPDNGGFHWSAIDPNYEQWGWYGYTLALNHDMADKGFMLDMEALRSADAVVLVLPCGPSAHLELGYAIGTGKSTAIWLNGEVKPELMYKMADLITWNEFEIYHEMKHLAAERSTT